jgi:hypothetical protein
LAKTQLFVLTTARTISRKAGGSPNRAPYFALSVSRTFKKYGSTIDHHVIIRRIVSVSHGASSVLPLTIFSILSAQ